MEVFNLMYKDYNIGTIAKLLGISSETLRYYESKNVIKPKRDPETGYRYYNAWDLHMLLQAKHYQSYGYTLKEIVKLFQHQELSDIADGLKDKEAAIEHEILLQMNRLNCIRQNQAMLRDAADSIGQFRIEKSPGIFRMNTQNDYTLNKSPEALELIEKWTQLTPFIYSCARFPYENVKNNDPCFEFAMGLNEEYAAFLGISAGEYVQYNPSRMCLHTCIPSRSGHYLSPECLTPAFEYMKKNGLELTGDIITQVVCMTRSDNEYHNWHIVWIPI